jgi:hypothetical protein
MELTEPAQISLDVWTNKGGVGKGNLDGGTYAIGEYIMVCFSINTNVERLKLHVITPDGRDDIYYDDSIDAGTYCIREYERGPVGIQRVIVEAWNGDTLAAQDEVDYNVLGLHDAYSGNRTMVERELSVLSYLLKEKLSRESISVISINRIRSQLQPLDQFMNTLNWLEGKGIIKVWEFEKDKLPIWLKWMNDICPADQCSTLYPAGDELILCSNPNCLTVYNKKCATKLLKEGKDQCLTCRWSLSMKLVVRDSLSGKSYELKIFKETTAREVIDTLIESGLIRPTPGPQWEWVLIDSRFFKIPSDERISSRVSSGSGENEVYLSAIVWTI